jgi:hypothetical protein
VSVELFTHDLGLSWVVAEPMARASHALADDGRVWLLDPVDDPAALAAAAALGEPAGVLQLLDRHGRDCEAIAERLGVEHLRVPRTVPDSPFELVPVLDLPGWREVALWWPERRGLAIAEVVGTGSAYAVNGGAAGIHPLLRLLPPGGQRGLAPEHLLVGHGPPLHGPGAAVALEHAYAHARRDIPGLLAKLPGLARRGR